MAYTGTIPSASLAVGDGLPAVWTQEVGGMLSALGAASTSYTPTLTGFTQGNGTWLASYIQIEKLVWFRAQFTFGTTSAAASAVPAISLPVAASSTNLLAWATQGFWVLGANVYQPHIRLYSSTTVGTWIMGASGLATVPTATTPATWATGDKIEVGAAYEAA